MRKVGTCKLLSVCQHIGKDEQTRWQMLLEQFAVPLATQHSSDTDSAVNLVGNAYISVHYFSMQRQKHVCKVRTLYIYISEHTQVHAYFA